MIAIVNYGLGNIQAFRNIFTRLGIPCVIAYEPKQLLGAQKIILPGVGAFDWAMNALNKSGMRDILDDMVINKHIPVLGICVGMQMMANTSEEGSLSGLGWIDGSVLRFDGTSLNKKIRLPHMGWNDVEVECGCTLFSGIFNPQFYFLHSYYFLPSNELNVVANTHYGIKFASALQKKNIFGVQFHPEKSHGWGVSLLENFLSYKYAAT
jgi:glutamine amidotransferase